MLIACLAPLPVASAEAELFPHYQPVPGQPGLCIVINPFSVPPVALVPCPGGTSP